MESTSSSGRSGRSGWGNGGRDITPPAGGAQGRSRRAGLLARRGLVAVATLVSMLAGLLPALPADAASVDSASFSGGAGTATVGGVLYAKQGAAMTLTVKTEVTPAKCVQVLDSGGTLLTQQTDNNSRTTWTFTSGAAVFTAASGSGTPSVQTKAWDKQDCSANKNETFVVKTASYTLDNVGPAVTGVLTPAPNGAGWNRADVAIAWSASDTGGSGVASGPTPATDSVTADTAGVTKSAGATDRVGNAGSGSVTVKLDKTLPTLTPARAPAANANGWNNSPVAVSFSPCSDALSGIKSCPASTTLSSDGANQSVTGTATDVADNSASATVSNISIDQVAPALSGAPTTAPNAFGWYKANVGVAWTCTDNLSGFASGACPSNSTISGEGTGLTASASVADQANNTTSATSSAVDIDRTAPVTTATAPPAWNNTDVTVTLAATDALSTVKATYYKLDGGTQGTYSAPISISAEGVHTVDFWSEDKAGNVETARSVQVKIDKTSPTIGHTRSPEANAYGWSNADVTVHFVCNDSLSGIKSCTPDQKIVTEGRNQRVTGTATDEATNTANDPVDVSIDKTAPTISATRTPVTGNAYGWNDADVVVNFLCGDALSGILSCPGAKTFGEGPGQAASGSVSDAAGNTASAGVTGINVDKTAPNLSGTATPLPNADGWYNNDVTVAWACSDALSGLRGATPTKPCPLADSTITGEGSNLSASASVTDLAGNTTTRSVGGIAIDRTAPATTASRPAGWVNYDVAVAFGLSDNLSGVKYTYFTIDGGATKTGSSATISGDGAHTLRYWSVDKAGNTEAAHTLVVRIDTQRPTIGHIQSPLANTAGWNNADVTISFLCDDQATLSGIQACTGARTLTTEGKDQVVDGEALDRAGNRQTDRATVSIDKTAPTIAGSKDRSANGAGWYNAPVAVTFACADPSPATGVVPSGVDTCPGATTLHEGADQSVPGTATDVAGNSAGTTVSGINVDETPPVLSGAATTTPNGDNWYKNDVTITWACTDQPGLSGIAAGACPPDSTIGGEGENLVARASVKDLAGNRTDADSERVRIDRTAPSTSISAPSEWVNSTATVTLQGTDALSGPAATYYQLDAGPITAYAGPISIATEGDHAIRFWSEDKAGNAEAARTARVKIDKSLPTISHALSPAANANNWNNQAKVTVTFTCADQPGLSGIRSCTSPQDVTAEGRGQHVPGEAVDNSGNIQTDDAVVNIDRTPPTITGTASPAANGAGWRNAEVTVGFACADPAPAGLSASGVSDCSAPTTLGQGRDQSVTGTATDAAGNSAGATVAGINVDMTAPTISGAPDRGANGAGWYNADVTVNWACADPDLAPGMPGSGIPTAACPAATTLTGEGNALSASATVLDAAGNDAGATLSGIRIDRAAPTTAADAPAGWVNTDVTVGFIANDGLSGPAGTYFTVDGATPATKANSVTISAEGVHTLSFWSVDAAGNVEKPQTATVKIDKSDPTITPSLAPAPNARGWNNADVTVSFTCADQPGLSGVATCVGDRTVTTEGPGQAVTGRATDNAGNTRNGTATVNLDKTKPSIAGKADRDPNANFWYNADVVVGFTCLDATSGIATCPTASTLGQGRNQSVTGTAADVAGNTDSATVGSINVDKTKPVLVGNPTSAANGAGWYNGDVTVAWSCTDPELAPGVAGSGIAAGACPGNAVIGGSGSGLTAEESVSDRADNTATARSRAVNIDRTDPVTTVTGSGSGWTNSNVTLTLSAGDNLSGVKATHFQLDTQPATTGTSVAITTEGRHTLRYWSVDAADNAEAENSIQVWVDKTAPTIGHTQSPVANGAGWNNGSVTVTFSCADPEGLSGLASCTPARTLTTEGHAQQVAGQAVDNAGNHTEDTASVSIDLTKPTISGSSDRLANNAGWYKAPVVVDFTCDDRLSGIATAGCAGGATLAADGAGQSVTGTATDAAGNVEKATVSGINLDATKPTLAGAATTGPNGAGWYSGDVTVKWTCGDTLSGIAPNACPADSTVTGEGADLSATASVVDRADNATTRSVGGIRIDRQNPVTTSDAPTGWRNATVTVRLTANDNLSLVKASYYAVDGGAQQTYTSAGIVISANGEHNVTFWSVDNADNAEGAHSVTVKVDTTNPTVSGAATTAPNGAGWYASPVTVRFTCSDTPSGIATCPGDATVGANGANQSATGTATDNAGNSASVTVGGLNVDTVAPAITGVNVDGQSYTLGAVPAASCTATDLTSGLDASGCKVTVTGGTANGVGTFNYTAMATDKAGNTATRIGTYRVVYGYGTTFFLQPINDTAHQVGVSTSIFKAGSTVPVKFQLKKADGTVVQAGSLPVWEDPAMGSTTSAAPNEAVYSAPADTTSTFRWDGQQYIYNWKTPSQSGNYWRIGVKLDDGTTQFVNIGLK